MYRKLVNTYFYFVLLWWVHNSVYFLPFLFYCDVVPSPCDSISLGKSCLGKKVVFFILLLSSLCCGGE